MGFPLTQENETFTYGDYRTWDDGERWELIDGIAYNMNPAPRIQHQRLPGRLFSKLNDFFKDKSCEPFLAPTDLLLPEGEEDDAFVKNTVQPDLFVICDPDKVGEMNCKGSPELVIEILSPSSVKRDAQIKRALYEKHGIKEF